MPTDVTLASAGGGTETAKVTVVDVGASTATLGAAIPGDGGCTVTPAPTSVAAGQRAVVTLAVGAGCEVAHGADISLSTGVTPATVVVKAAPVPAAEKAHWAILLYALGISAAVALLLAAVVVALVLRHNSRPGARPLGWGTRLQALGTDWSFKDNWVNSVTLGSGAIVALLAASDVLKAVLGAEPDAALGLMAVAGALSAALVGISPLFVKLVGPDLSVPTIGGTILAAVVTIVGSVGQIAALTWQGTELVSGWVRAAPIGFGVGIGAVVTVYATRALWSYVVEGSEEKPPTQSDALKAAEVVAAAIRGRQPAIDLAAAAAPQRIYFAAARNSLL